MPAPAAKPPWSLILHSDMVDLAAYATSLGLDTEAGSGWSYDVPVVGWLRSSSTPPGVLNRIRRDLRTVLEDIDPVFGSRGWPDDCLVSGPWVLPPDKYYSGGVPGTDPGGGVGTWAGVQTGGAGAHAWYRDLVCFAWEEILELMARADVSQAAPQAWDGSAYALDQGWSGTWDSGLGGWVSLSLTLGISPASDVIGYQGGADGFVYVTLANSGADVSAMVNGSAGTVTEVADAGAFKYCVDVTGLSAVTSLVVVINWTEATYGAALAFGSSFSVEHSYAATTTDAALAEMPWTAAASPDFRVTAAGGYQVGTTWAWPVFSDGDDRGTEQFCLFAKTLPAQRIYHHDYGLFTPRLSPQWAAWTGTAKHHPECYAPPTQRADSGNFDGTPDGNGRVRDGLAHGGTKPSWTVPTSPGVYRCEAVYGVWAWRRGKPMAAHAPLLPGFAADAAGLPTLGAEVIVEVGKWAFGSFDAGALPGTWTGGEFSSLASFTLGAQAGYAYFPLAYPWPALENKALVWQATPDAVEVSGLVVVLVELPTGGTGAGLAADWDAKWPGDVAAGYDRDADAAVATFPAAPNDPGDPWVDFPPVAYNAAMTLAAWNDTVALLGVFASRP